MLSSELVQPNWWPDGLFTNKFRKGHLMSSHRRILICATLLLGALGTSARAYESIALPQLEEGNMLGLAYRQSDGHFFVTQEALDSSTWPPKGLVYELDRSGRLLQTVNLGTLVPGVAGASVLLNNASMDGFYVSASSYQQSTDTFSHKVYKLSADLKSMTASGVPELLQSTYPQTPYMITGMTDSDFYAHDHWGGTGTGVFMMSRATGTVRAVDLSAYKGAVAGCREWDGALSICINSVAPSWNGGFFVINEGRTTEDDNSYVSRLLEFDSEGKLLHGMEFDPSVYDYHPLAMAVDPSTHSVFVSFNNHFIATVTEQDLKAGVLSVPEPGTWSLWLLGGLMMIGSGRRWAGHRVA
ncbi:MAG TPA: hypothetical protein VFW93_09680 [Aquabacterium sp.]|uniref:hypothetical protein n=1 Tax=Aquabacterium sp. TaxID=1872578 RepID=UPI002E322184|nr:hypothetical protein [Aquabacterium sp.]HEX5356478.1 hypothetical protein [Aquabacterium sp.]